ncbi:hypothetical protein GXP67_24920 [Rhodocytophaga rosea]|uniref:Uncharacterized protein n=1 Tax=Rhodocytophaga rosea TaxID=2704465 RepID=A0A6C0GNN6_9BACT|nr:hypothetical protein [Rhodocytophaga rosea]QHT69658.1 hypothetical protein GXP67_24920 [Rhodocytophaga rosea]
MNIRIIFQSDELFKEVEDVTVPGYGIEKMENVKIILEEAIVRPNTTLFVAAQDPYEQKEIETDLDDMFSGFEQIKQPHLFDE